MWIVRLALRRPYTVAIMVLLILSMGLLSLSRMIVDIFPVIDIPVVIVVWNYPGLSPEDMERRVVLIRSSRSPRPSLRMSLLYGIGSAPRTSAIIPFSAWSAWI